MYEPRCEQFCTVTLNLGPSDLCLSKKVTVTLKGVAHALKPRTIKIFEKNG